MYKTRVCHFEINNLDREHYIVGDIMLGCQIRQSNINDIVSEFHAEQIVGAMVLDRKRTFSYAVIFETVD